MQWQKIAPAELSKPSRCPRDEPGAADTAMPALNFIQARLLSGDPAR
jgi:hypothetical protein